MGKCRYIPDESCKCVDCCPHKDPANPANCHYWCINTIVCGGIRGEYARQRICDAQNRKHTEVCRTILPGNTPLRTQPERREDNAPDSGCAACRWRNRRQKCSCCRRNRHLKDCWEEER